MILHPTEITGSKTDSRAIIIPKLLDRVYKRKCRSLSIIEIGTIRDTSVPNVHMMSDGYSTLYLTCWAANHLTEHEIISIDIETNTCKEYLTRYALDMYVHFIEEDSVLALDNLSGDPDYIADFIYFDGDNDPDVIISELCTAIPILDEGSIIAFDDFDLNAPAQKKGRILLPLLGELGIPYEMFNNRICYIDLTTDILTSLDEALV